MKTILRIGSLRSPPLSGCAGLLPVQGQNKTPRNTLFINGSTVSTSCCATSKRGKGGGASHQRGIAFPRPSGRLYGFSCCRKAAFILAPIRAPTTTLAPKGETTHYDLCVALLLQIMFAVHARGASNLSPLRTFGPKGRQPSSPIG